MSSAIEMCGCGARIEIRSDHDNRVRTALEEWRAGHRHDSADGPKLGGVEATPQPEHHPEGNNFSSTERRGPQLEPYEMHSQYRPDSYGQISLKWRPIEKL